MSEEQKLEVMIYIDEEINRYFNQVVAEKSVGIKKAIINEINSDLKTENVVDRIFGKTNVRNLTISVQSLIEKYLKDLESIQKYSSSIKEQIIDGLTVEKQKMMDQAKKNTQAIVDGQKEEIIEMAGQAYDLVSFIERAKVRIIEEVVREVTKRVEQEDVRPREIHIITSQGNTILENDLYHEKFETIYKLERIGLPVMLIGPTGSGKSVCASQVAKALGLQMYYTNNASEEYKLLGFTDANGKYKQTQFYKAFIKGGLFFLDEIDNSHPSALLSLNSAIGSSDGHIYMAFEDGEFTQAHNDFRVIAAANTWGNGANRMYCGRSELDSASLDRFVQIYFDYDKKLEKSIVSEEDMLTFFWDFRKVINDCGIRHTVTTRNIEYAFKMKKTGFSNEEILLYTVIKELDVEDMKIISKRFKEEEFVESEYTKEFNTLLLKRA